MELRQNTHADDLSVQPVPGSHIAAPKHLIEAVGNGKPGAGSSGESAHIADNTGCGDTDINRVLQALADHPAAVIQVGLLPAGEQNLITGLRHGISQIFGDVHICVIQLASHGTVFTGFCHGVSHTGSQEPCRSMGQNLGIHKHPVYFIRMIPGVVLAALAVIDNGQSRIGRTGCRAGGNGIYRTPQQGGYSLYKIHNLSAADTHDAVAAVLTDQRGISVNFLRGTEPGEGMHAERNPRPGQPRGQSRQCRAQGFFTAYDAHTVMPLAFQLFPTVRKNVRTLKIIPGTRTHFLLVQREFTSHSPAKFLKNNQKPIRLIEHFVIYYLKYKPKTPIVQ